MSRLGRRRGARGTVWTIYRCKDGWIQAGESSRSPLAQIETWPEKPETRRLQDEHWETSTAGARSETC